MWDQVTMATRLKALILGLDKKKLRKTVEADKKALPSSVEPALHW